MASKRYDQFTDPVTSLGRDTDLSDIMLVGSPVPGPDLGKLAKIPQGDIKLNASMLVAGTIPAARYGVATIAINKLIFPAAGGYLDSFGNFTDPATGLIDPTTTVGDMIYRNNLNQLARLPKGTTGQKLTMVAGNVAWATDLPGGGAPLEMLGTIYDEDGWGDLSDFTQSNATWTVSAATLLANNGGSGFSNTLSINHYTLLEQWVIRAKMFVASPSVDGLWVGVKSVNAAASNVIGRIHLTGADAGKVTLNLGVGDTLVATSTTALAFSDGDQLELMCEMDLGQVTVMARNLTTGGSPAKVSFDYVLDSNPAMQNTGRFAVGNMGGTGSVTVTSIKVTSAAPKNADIYVLGNSKTQGYYADTFADSFVGLLKQHFTVINGGGGADRVSHMLLRVPEIVLLEPKVVLLADLTSNDERAGTPSATYEADYQSIVNDLTAAGITVIHLGAFPETGQDNSSQQAFTETYPLADRIDVYYELLNTGGAIHGDGIHLTNLGHDVAFHKILEDGKISELSKQKSTTVEGASNQVAFWTNNKAVRGSDDFTYVGGVLKVGPAFQCGSGFTYTNAGVSAGWLAFNPTVSWYAHLSPVNNGVWDAFAYLNEFYFRAVNDTITGATNWLVINRTALVINTVSIPNGRLLVGNPTDDNVTQVQVNGDMLINGAYFGTVSSVIAQSQYFGAGKTSLNWPMTYWQALTAGADLKYTDIYFDTTGNVVMRFVNDAKTGANSIFEIARTGFAVASWKFPFLGGVGSRMMTVAADGTIGVAAIPSGGGVTTMAAFGTAPNANGATIAGVNLTLQPANATNPGGLSAVAQEIGGIKTFKAEANFQGTGVSIIASGGNTGIFATGSSFGGSFTSPLVGMLASNNSTTAGVVIAGIFQRNGSYTAAAGDGVELRFATKNSLDLSKDIAKQHAVISTVTAGAESASFIWMLMQGGVNAATKMTLYATGMLEPVSLKTGAPTGGTAREWKIGDYVAAAVALDTAHYVEVEINGTLRKLAIVT